jgi:hypothetical protein
VRDPGDYPPAGGALDQVHLRGIRRDRQVIHADEVISRPGRVFAQRQHVPDDRCNPDDVLVVTRTRREG